MLFDENATVSPRASPVLLPLTRYSRYALMVEQYSPTKRARPLSFALPSSSSSSGVSFNSSNSSSRPLSPDSTTSSRSSTRPTHRSTASLSSLAQLNLNSGGPSSHSPLPLSPRTPNSLERSPSLHWGTFSTTQQPSLNGTSGGNGNGVGKEFEHVQNKTFAKWLNARLEPNGYPPVNDLGTDFSDGTRLIQLIVSIRSLSISRVTRI